MDRIQEDRQEWRAFNLEGTNQRSRTGMPASLARHDMGLATVIGKIDKDASGRSLEPSMCSTMRRLRIWDSRTRAYISTDKSLQNAFNELDKIKDKLALSDATVEKGLAPGRTISSKVISATYIACREMGTPKTLDEVAIACNVTRKELARCYRLLYIELGLKIRMVDPMRCIAKIANKVNLSEKTKRQAMNIMYDVIGREISAGKDPMGLAAAVIYMSCKKIGEDERMIDLAQAARVTEVTIRKRYNELRINSNKNNNNKINYSIKKTIFLPDISTELPNLFCVI